MAAVAPTLDRPIDAFRRRHGQIVEPPGAAWRPHLELGRGLTVCIFNDDAREDGWLEEARRMIRHSRGFTAELLPTALAGQP